MTPAAVAECVREVYASARYYTDRGRLLGERRGAKLAVTFETAFERPNVFTFAFSLDAPALPVDAELERALTSLAHGLPRNRPIRLSRRIEAYGDRIRMGDPEWRRGFAASLDSALGVGAALSFGASVAIPRLLMPARVSGANLLASTTPLRLSESDFHWQLHITHELGPRLVSVDKVSYAIRRIIETSAGRTTSTDYHPVLTR